MLLGEAVASASNTGHSLLKQHIAGLASSNLHKLERPSSLKLECRSTSGKDVQSIPLISRADEMTDSAGTLSASQSTADDSVFLTASLDTSTLRRHLSSLEFDSATETKSVRRHAKSASEIILLRNCSTDATKATCSPPKPKVQKLRRRKQEFDQLLRTPPFDRQNVSGKTSMERQMSEADSGFGSCESGTSAIESELRLSAESSHVRSVTPPRQIRVRSPLVDTVKVEPMSDAECVGDSEEDMNMMLFTPFKIGVGSAELPELSPDIELSASIVAGSDSWDSFTPISTGFRVRTSTPCQLRSSTPETGSGSPGGQVDHHTSSRLLCLLGEFSDDALCTFGGDMVHCENMTLSGLTAWDG